MAGARTTWIFRRTARVCGVLGVAALLNVVVAVGCALWSPLGWRCDDFLRVIDESQHYQRYLDIPRDDSPDISASGVETYTIVSPHPTTVARFFNGEMHNGIGIRQFRFTEWEPVDRFPLMPMDHREQYWALRAGWPCLSIHCLSAAPVDVTSDSSSWRWGFTAPSLLEPHRDADEGVTRPIPLRPIPLGFALNTLLYAAAMYSVWWGFTRHRQLRRLRRGACARCGYEVGVLAVCPECGARTPVGRAAAIVPAVVSPSH